ncbi:hypothetical protein FBQ97_00770 [Acidobacteria bacterium ACD]|nr:MAG: hypothetical protein EDX89_14420 [Acidobacteriota bacterium]MCE7957628.1 hypothetical protein [Acidobacteria bacterium ACB2]MDL1948335.1 hypothetical protein [Acidobacteria bacterium ACD]
MFVPLVLLLAAPTPTPRPVATIAPKVIGETQSDSGLGAAAKKIKLNRNVSFDQNVVPDPPAPTATPKPGAAPAVTPHASDVLTDEKRWRDRKAKLEADLAAAEKEYDKASALNTVSTTGDPNAPEYQAMLAARNAALTPYRMKVDELRRELTGLPEECRRTIGCQPGWVR